MSRMKNSRSKDPALTDQSTRFRVDEQTLQLFEQLCNDDQDEQALRLLAEAVTGVSHPELRATLKEALSNVGDIDRAYEICLSSAQKNQGSGPLLFQLGELAVALDKTAEACAHFKDAQQAGEETVDLYQLWGASELALGNIAEAGTLFQTALELAPDRVSEVYSAWGKAYCDAGHPKEAHEKLSVSIAADAGAFYPHAYMGVVALQLGKPDEAEPAFRKALSLIPAGHEAYAAWIVQELAAVVETRHGGAAAAETVMQALKSGRRSLALFERLRRLTGLTVGPRGKRFVLVVAGEDAEGDYYEECEVDADNEEGALGFVRAVHEEAEAEHLVVADLKVTGKAGGPFAGVVDISDKTRVPEILQEGAADDDDDE
ncbi:MAG: tetratricopeptide repeat protein [Deltaproteobacteria bacterium]|nr:tetratricopeptide repeat protein [Deltaproteobacteria bacterium]